MVALGDGGTWDDDMGIHPVGMVGIVSDASGALGRIDLGDTCCHLGSTRIIPIHRKYSWIALPCLPAVGTT